MDGEAAKGSPGQKGRNRPAFDLCVHYGTALSHPGHYLPYGETFPGVGEGNSEADL